MHSLLAATALSCGLASASAWASDWQSLLDQGRQACEAGRFDEANALQQQALSAAGAERGAGSAELADGLGQAGDCQLAQGKTEAAATQWQQALALREKLAAAGSAETAGLLHRLAKLQEDQGNYAEAEPLFTRAVALREQFLGGQHPELATSINGLAEVQYFQGHLADAEAHFARALAIREQALGPDHAKVGESLNNMGIVLDERGQYARAEPLYARALAVRQKALGPDHPDVAETLNNYANLYVDEGNYAKAEPLYQQALAIYEKANGPDDVGVALPLNNLAVLYDVQGQFMQAEPVYRRELAIYEKALGPDHPDVAVALQNLAHIYYAEGRFDAAEPLYLRALAINEKSPGGDSPVVATTLSNLGNLYRAQGRYAEAAAPLARGLAIREKTLGAAHIDVANSLTFSAQLHVDQHQLAAAEPEFLRALRINESALGPEHPDVALNLNSLAALYRAQGQYAKAEPLYLRALAIREKALRSDHPDVAQSLRRLAELYGESKRPLEGLRFARRATEIYRRRISAAGVDDAAAREAAKNRPGFLQHLALLATNPGHQPAATVTAEALQVVQLEQATGTEAAIAKMAMRFARGNDPLAALARRKQDAASSLANVETQLLKAASKPPEKRSSTGEAALRLEASQFSQELERIDRELAAGFPEYLELTRPKPLELAQLQALLRPAEAMLVYAFDEKAGGFLWVVQPHSARFVRLKTSAPELGHRVESLRAQMDLDANGQALPVDLASLQALYTELIAPAVPALKGVKHLLVVPEGPLVSLPLGMLVASPPPVINRGADYAKVDWLIGHYAISVLPTVSSIRAFRQFAKSTEAPMPFAGFGDPLLEGGSLVATAAGHRGVQANAVTRGMGLARLAAAASADPQAAAVADVEAIRSQMRLPETAQELEAMAKTLGAGPGTIWLRENATVSAVQRADLSQYRTIAFATHGVMASEAASLGVAEAGLILTPPKHASSDDDGYLSASRIALLKLNADWVLLSACNTAAADGTTSGEGFSGLAKAFFYAGSRSLLVSNWWVNSEATVALTTRMLARYQAHPQEGKAEAERVAMRSLMHDAEHPEFAHPMYWAPFVVVGEGGADAR